PDFLDVTMASAGVLEAPIRFCSADGESTVVQLRFGFDAFRSNESDLETRYGSEPPHVSTEAAVLPPFEDEKNALMTSPPYLRTSRAVARTAAVDSGSSPLP